MSWTNAVITEAGHRLQAALLGTGDGLIFTRAVAADAEGVERLDLTLQSPCTVDGPKCRVPVLLTNAGVETSFTMTELRFYVRRVTDGALTGEEILYATVTDETGDPIPTAAQSPGFTIDWAFVFQYGNAGNVTVTLDPVGLVSIGMVGQPGGVAALGDNGAVPVSQGGTGATTAQAALTALGAMRADATGEDIPVSKTDGTTIHAALANKVGFSDELCSDANDFLQRYKFFGVNSETANIPAGDFGAAVNFGGTNGAFLQLLFERHGYVYARGYAAWLPEGSRFTDWAKFVTAIPPQVRNLTLQPGFIKNSDCTFFVTQESTVHLAGGVSGTLPANQDTQIGTLQADARPTYQCRRPAVTNAGAAYIDIHTDGTVWVHPFAAASECWFDTSFVAGGAQ